MARAKLWHVAAQRIPDAGMEGFIIYGRAPLWVCPGRHARAHGGRSVEGDVFQVGLRECMSEAECEKHYWHVSGSIVMCAHRIGRARGVAAKVVDVVTAFMGAVLGICGVQRAGLHEAVETVMEVVGR